MLRKVCLQWGPGLPGLGRELAFRAEHQASSRRSNLPRPGLALSWPRERGEGNVGSAPKPPQEGGLRLSCFLFNV